MKMPKQFISLKAILFAVLAAALFSAPVAGAVHVETVPSENCVEDTEAAAPERHHEDHDHEDHAHQCGQCHVHILRNNPVVVVFLILEHNREPPMRSDDALSSSLDALFRPPKR